MSVARSPAPSALVVPAQRPSARVGQGGPPGQWIVTQSEHEQFPLGACPNTEEAVHLRVLSERMNAFLTAEDASVWVHGRHSRRRVISAPDRAKQNLLRVRVIDIAEEVDR